MLFLFVKYENFYAYLFSTLYYKIEETVTFFYQSRSHAIPNYYYK